MRILAVDTSNSTCGTGVYDIDLSAPSDIKIKEVSYRLSLEKRTHSEVVLPLIKEVMDESKSSQTDIDYYACTVGPGSFTGIRIGVSTIKGMAVVTDKPAIEISSTEALARSVDLINANSETYVLACFDARNKRVFASVYDSEMNMVVEENAYASDELITKMFEVIGSGKRVIVCGNGAGVIESQMELIENKPEALIEYAPGAVILPKGIAKVAAVKLVNNDTTTALKLTPKYCAKSQAERFKKPIEAVVRPADISEVSSIMVLEAEGIDHPWTMDAIKELVNDENKIALVAVNRENNEVMGYIGVSTVLDEAEVGNLCVLGKYRRIGIATRIMNALSEELKARQIKNLFLEVNHDNYRAIALYEKCGFKAYGSRKDYYGQGKDADLYKLEL